MIFSRTLFSTGGFSKSDISAASAFTAWDLIDDQDAKRSYLLHATPYDPGTSAETDVRASSGIQMPIVDSAHWPAVLGNAVDSQIDLFGDEEDSTANVSFGNLNLFIGDGEHDDWCDYYWDGRDVAIYLGADGYTFSQYIEVLSGTVKDITHTDSMFSLVYKGREEYLDKEIQETLYAGTGGLEGDDNSEGGIKETPKPLCFGYCRNISPVLVDETNQIYQIHDGSIREVSRAFDGGLDLDFEGDVADIEATTVTPGYYKTQVDSGYIRLGAVPEKAFTCDVYGDNTDDFSNSHSAPYLCRYIATQYTDLTEDDLDLQSFKRAHLDSQRVYCSIYINESRSVESVLTELMQSVGGAWTFNRQGKLKVSVLRWRYSSGTITENDVIKDSFKRLNSQPPSWQRRLSWTKNWTVQSEDQLLGAVSSGRRTFCTNEYRYVNDEDSGIKTSRKAARAVQKNTLLANQASANTECTRQQEIFGGNLIRIDVTTRRQQFRYQVGQTITLQYSRFDIDRDFVILGIRENTETQETAFRLLG